MSTHVPVTVIYFRKWVLTRLPNLILTPLFTLVRDIASHFDLSSKT